MGLFNSKKADVKAFASQLAEKLAKRYPAAIDNNPAKRVSENRLTRVLEETLGEARAFQDEHRLGILGKARLGNEFRWELKERGYTDAFINVATEGLMVFITRGGAPTKVGTDAG